MCTFTVNNVHEQDHLPPPPKCNRLTMYVLASDMLADKLILQKQKTKLHIGKGGGGRPRVPTSLHLYVAS